MNRLPDQLRFWRDHRWAPQRMSAYLDDDLPVSARRRMQRHLGACHDCRRLLEGLRQVVDALHRLPPPAIPGDRRQLAVLVRTRIEQAPRP